MFLLGLRLICALIEMMTVCVFSFFLLITYIAAKINSAKIIFLLQILLAICQVWIHGPRQLQLHEVPWCPCFRVSLQETHGTQQPCGFHHQHQQDPDHPMPYPVQKEGPQGLDLLLNRTTSCETSHFMLKYFFLSGWEPKLRTLFFSLLTLLFAGGSYLLDR